MKFWPILVLHVKVVKYSISGWKRASVLWRSQMKVRSVGMLDAMVELIQGQPDQTRCSALARFLDYCFYSSFTPTGTFSIFMSCLCWLSLSSALLIVLGIFSRFQMTAPSWLPFTVKKLKCIQHIHYCLMRSLMLKKYACILLKYYVKTVIL